MTSLAKQLQRLAVPHTKALLGEDRKKLSLLFDKETAASIDRETFHSIGYNGLLELENIDETFQEFEAPLFGDASLNFERTTQSKESNDKIDGIISRFLIKLSPYCLLRPAHKALEWLIQRFYINYYNIDDLLMCFLPYHETKIFARVLLTVKFDTKLRSKWDFLAAGQMSGLHLPKKDLVKYCASNVGFLSFICYTVPKYVKVLAENDHEVKNGRVLFSFYATTVIAVLESGTVTEEQIGMLIPHISSGMYSNVLDYKAASYMILSQVFHKARLKTDVLKGLQKVLGKSIVPDLAGEAVACFMLMFQTQDITVLKGHRYLCREYYIIDRIAELSDQFDGQKFLSCFLKNLIPSAFKRAVSIATSGEDTSDGEGGRLGIKAEYVSMLHRLLSNVQLPSDLAEQTAYNFLQVYIKHGNKYVDEEVDERVKDALQGIVRQLEGKHSSEVDKAVSRVLKECETKKQKELVQEFLNLFVLSVPRQLVTDSETSLVLSLNHRLPVVREKAVTTLIKNRHAVEDTDFLSNSLILRLKDDDRSVVQAALQIGHELWQVVGDDGQTISILQRLLFLGLDEHSWSEPALLAAKLLGSYQGSEDKMAVTNILPCFFLTSLAPTNLEIINTLLASVLAKHNGILSKIALGWQKKKKETPKKKKIMKKEEKQAVAEINVSLAHSLAEAFSGELKKDGITLIKELCHQALSIEDKKMLCLMFISLDNLVTMEKDESLKLDILMNLLKLADESKTIAKSYSDSKVTFKTVDLDWSIVIAEQLDSVKANIVPVEFYLKALLTILKSIKVPEIMVKESGFWQYTKSDSQTDKFLLLSIRLYDILSTGALTKSIMTDVYRDLLKLLESTCFEKPEIYMKFFGLLWTCHCNDLAFDLHLTLYLQAKTLHIGLAYIELLKDVPKFLERNPSVLVNLLFVLGSKEEEIRKCGQAIIKYLYGICKDTDLCFVPLMKKIVHCAGEIGTDHTYINRVVHSVFKSSIPDDVLKIEDVKGSVETQTSKKDQKSQSLSILLSIIRDEKSPYFVQHRLLVMFSLLNNEPTLTLLLPLMDRLLQKVKKEEMVSKKVIECLNLLIQRYTEDSIQCLNSKHSGLKLFLMTLTVGQSVNKVASPQITAISQITLELYLNIEDSAQHQILSTLFDVYMKSSDLEVTSQIRRVLKHIQLDGNHIREEMKKCLRVSTAKTVREAKRQRKSFAKEDEEENTEFDNKEWQRVTIVLETVQNKKKLTNHNAVAPVCFQILASILESDNHSSAEYLKQLILGVLQNICMRMEMNKDQGIVSEEEFNMDLIVNCIRSSDNPQTHHQALLLLTSSAKIYPEHLLHNMMSVFTFMGANTMRQDDAYSFQIISKILETVVPALIMACEQRKHVPKGITNDLDDIITMVIQVFVDSYPYIPRHRRLVLFNKLLSVIGEGQYLWRTLLLMLEMVVAKGTLKNEINPETQESGVGVSRTDESDLEFCLTLCAEFAVPVQLTSACHMMEYVMKLPNDKDDDSIKHSRPAPQSFGKLRKDDAKLFNVALHTSKQLRHFKYANIYFLTSLFSSQEFFMQVAECGEEDLMSNFQSVLETLLQFISNITTVANKTKDKQRAKFWKTFLHKVYFLLDKLVSILPDHVFTEVICGLVSHELPNVQRKAMELLNTKLQQQREVREEEEVAVLLPMVTQLCDMVEINTSKEEMTEDDLVNTQTAFISLKLLCRNIGHQNTTEFLKVLKVSLAVFKNNEISLPVSSCALLCMAEICHTLKVHTIPQLPHFMPLLVKVLGNHESLLKNELYLMSVVTTVNKIVEKLSNFLSPYLQNIIKNVCILSSKPDTDVLQKQHVQQRLKAIRSTLSATLPTRVLLPAATKCYNQLIEKNLVTSIPLHKVLSHNVNLMSTILLRDDFCITEAEKKKLVFGSSKSSIMVLNFLQGWKIAVSSLLSLMGDHLGTIAREDLNSHLTELQSFFMNCLDLRVEYPELPDKQIFTVEGFAIETIITMVLKLSESSFKPFLFKLFEWATSDDEINDRVLVFYRLADSLAERLRSLFTIFAGHIVTHAAKILEMNNSIKEEENVYSSDKIGEEKTCQLLTYILDCLYKCCLYDTEGFMTKERFDTLLHPLVDQVENELGGEMAYTERVHKHLVPCIVQMTVASHDDSLWRSLNYQVCLKTRSQDPKVKDAALEVLDQLHKKLGEEYMPLLPDTVPFLAELMEDDSEDVERKCQAVIQDMEKTLGEPLQKYF